MTKIIEFPKSQTGPTLEEQCFNDVVGYLKDLPASMRLGAVFAACDWWEFTQIAEYVARENQK
jgi:hypothetical protein